MKTNKNYKNSHEHKVRNTVAALLAILICSVFLCACGGRDTTEEEDLREQGIAMMDQENYDAALQLFNEALSQSVGVIDELEIDIDLYKGIALYNLDKLDEALEVYDAIIDYDNGNSLAYYYRGTVYLKNGDLSQATADYDELLQLDGTYENYVNVIENLRDAGEDDTASVYISKALKLEAKTTDDQRNQAYLYYLSGDKETACTAFETLAADGDEESLLYLSKYLIEDGDYNGALTYIDQGLQNQAGEFYGEFLFQEGVCYEYLENYTGAYKIFEQYLTLYPDDEIAQREATFLSTREYPEEEDTEEDTTEEEGAAEETGVMREDVIIDETDDNTME